MKTGPLNESELEWLDDILTKYNTDHAILDVAELDGLLTAVLSSPQVKWSTKTGHRVRVFPVSIFRFVWG